MVDVRQRLEAALVGRYTLVREIGRGGMAIVYLAHDLRHDREVALKTLRPELVASLGPERFLREIKLAASLSHPHILPLHDSGDAGGCLFYVMPYVQGESLRDLLVREERLSLRDAVGIAQEVADALAYAHHAGIVHRDVKPGNILLQAGHAVVSDFGIARAIRVAGADQVTATGLAVGTREYMSPEQAYGESDVDGRTDIYGLGCVLYEMLVGRPPGGGTTPGGHHTPGPRDIRNGLNAVHPPIPPQVAEVVVRALAETPADRFPNAEQFGAALVGMDGSAVAPVRWPRRVGMILGLSVLLIGLAYGLRSVLDTSRLSRSATGSTLDPTHIAVLYFDDRTESNRLAPVAAGITEDLIDRLGEVRVLKVISPEGVRPYRRSAVHLDSIARTLQVGTIVAGSVTGVADQLRVSVRMIDGTSGQQLYSRTVQLPRNQILELQDSITTEIAEFLRRRLGEAVSLRESRAGTRSVEAWELVRRADALLEDSRSFEKLNAPAAAVAALLRADTLLVQAEARDGRWAVPKLTRGWVARNLSLLSTGAAEKKAWLEQGIAHANGVLSRRPGDPKALVLRGQLGIDVWLQALTDDREWTRRAAEEDLRSAVTAAPELAQGWYALSLLLSNTGRAVEADNAARRALEADAYLTEARGVMASLFFSMLYRERFEDARFWCGQGRRRFPDDPNFVPCELRLLGWSARGQPAIMRAWRLLAGIEVSGRRDESPLDPLDRRLMVAAVVARTGLRDSANAILRRAREGVSDSVLALAAVEEAGVRVLLGQRQEAIHLLQSFLASQPQLRETVAQNPWLATLRGDAGFEALTRTP